LVNGRPRALTINVKTRRLLQIWKQVVTRLLSSRYQNVFRTAYSRLLWQVRKKLLYLACCKDDYSNIRFVGSLEQLVASLLASSALLQDDNSLFRTSQQLGTSRTKTSCWRRRGKIFTRVSLDEHAPTTWPTRRLIQGHLWLPPDSYGKRVGLGGRKKTGTLSVKIFFKTP
jgi:hypothetical protein